MADTSMPVYLGDGVYAAFDGYQIWLSVGDHRNQVVALEPDVMAALKRYEQELGNMFGTEKPDDSQDQ